MLFWHVKLKQMATTCDADDLFRLLNSRTLRGTLAELAALAVTGGTFVVCVIHHNCMVSTRLLHICFGMFSVLLKGGEGGLGGGGAKQQVESPS